jgi:chemotaxis protein MotB
MYSRFSRRAASSSLRPSIEGDFCATRARGPWLGDDVGWLITLSDLTLLLLCFLVLWYMNENKKKAIPPPLAPASKSISPEIPAPAVVAALPNAEQWTELRSDIRQFIGSLGLERDVVIDGAPNEILLSLKDRIPFESGKAELRAAALPLLEKVAAIALAQPSVNLEISGHTDDRPIATAAYPSNWELSAGRASRVGRYLIERGVPPSRIAVQGYANQRPRLPNVNAGNRSGNRRVEIRLYYNPEVNETLPRSSADDRP